MTNEGLHRKIIRRSVMPKTITVRTETSTVAQARTDVGAVINDEGKIQTNEGDRLNDTE